LSSDDSNSDDGTSEQSSQSEDQIPVQTGQPETGKSKWTLTKQAFDKLLAAFSSDRDEAANQYQLMQHKLVRYFEVRGLDSAEDLADETINRVARKIDEGTKIENLNGFFFGVAHNVGREPRPKPTPLDDLPPRLMQQESQVCEPDPRLECFDRCITKMPKENQSLIMDYYREERRKKIELRQQLADTLRIPLNALRIRAHRIRKGLEECIFNCLELQERNE